MISDFSNIMAAIMNRLKAYYSIKVEIERGAAAKKAAKDILGKYPDIRPSYACHGPTPYASISRRDYFAARAMEGLLASYGIGPRAEIPKLAVEYADYFIAELDKEKEK